MHQIIRRYSNGEVTVVWQPGICQHSGICFTGLPEVFDPDKRPWVRPIGASTQQIVEQVKRCPSGALSCFLNAEKGREDGEDDGSPKTGDE